MANAPSPRDGKGELDFNKAENPPCAFTPFATRPLPPKQNILPVRIDAGQMATRHRVRLHVSGFARFLRGHVSQTAAAEHTLAELFAFLRTHLLPTVAHPLSPFSAVAWPAAKSSEQD